MPRKLPLRPLKAKGARERNKRSQTLAGLIAEVGNQLSGRTYEDEKGKRAQQALGTYSFRYLIVLYYNLKLMLFFWGGSAF